MRRFAARSKISESHDLRSNRISREGLVQYLPYARAKSDETLFALFHLKCRRFALEHGFVTLGSTAELTFGQPVRRFRSVSECFRNKPSNTWLLSRHNVLQRSSVHGRYINCQVLVRT